MSTQSQHLLQWHPLASFSAIVDSCSWEVLINSYMFAMSEVCCFLIIQRHLAEGPKERYGLRG